MFPPILFALIFTLFGIAFPPLLIIGALFWLLLYIRIRRNLSTGHEVQAAKLHHERQRTYDKGVRYFLS